MKLITKEIIKKTPKIGEGDQKTTDELQFVFKLFAPWTHWTWYIAEADFETGEAFGLCCGFEKELGYLNLKELEEIRGPFGLRIERDKWFEPCSYKQALQQG
jgi:hypothetical protein